MRLPLIFGCAVLSGLLLSVQVSAQDSVPLFGDKTPDIVNPARSVSQLINQGKYADAMNLADKELAANPQNVNLRFLRGVIFMETKKNDEAKRVFEQLIPTTTSPSSMPAKATSDAPRIFWSVR